MRYFARKTVSFIRSLVLGSKKDQILPKSYTPQRQSGIYSNRMNPIQPHELLEKIKRTQPFDYFSPLGTKMNDRFREMFSEILKLVSISNGYLSWVLIIVSMHHNIKTRRNTGL
uniref:Uncharacterized protein n=1 Tax=Schistocephalus solidus TaxID=70667 RepID=A0A0V0J3D3_SCHSO